MPLKNDAFPSSAAFDIIANSLGGDIIGRKAALKQANAVFAFTLKNKDGQTATWYIDLKETGEVGKGEAPAGKKADVTMTLSESDFGQLVEGKANAQKLFMNGGLKIKGNMMKAAKIEPVLKKARTSAKL
ncbi:MAG: hypothetical protein M1823_000898 [Watsoniomyces obsoletus]|nr:MAG: hypothetical protein M1823_000898 [Watsoniomyces obsoletus]